MLNVYLSAGLRFSILAHERNLFDNWHNLKSNENLLQKEEITFDGIRTF